MTDLEIPETGAVFTFGKSRFAENKPSHFFIKNDPVVHVACGDEHTAVICSKSHVILQENGRIFAFGSNEWGQLGLGHNNMVHKPSCIKALKPEKAKFIACGRAHTIILTESNNIYACGSNTDGQLGLENIDMVNTPTKLQHSQLKENGTIKKLSAGSQHSAALTDSGLVFVWGSNSEGQLGLESNKTNSKLPTLLEFKDKIRDISCGYYHTAVLTETGQLFTFGENENGKLGLPQGESQTYKPTRVNIDMPLTSVSCGGNHNFGLTEDGTAIAFGSNVNGELGFDKEVTWISEPRILPQEMFENEKLYMIACGDSHTAFITESFKIFTCGDSRHGKLCQDDNSEEDHFGPKAISRFNGYKVTNVSCGGCHTIICAQKIPEDTNSVLPPLQRIPNSILHSESKTDLSAISPSPDNIVNGLNEVKTSAENSNEIVHETKVNGITEINNISEQVIQNVPKTIEDAKISEQMAALSSEIENLPDDISDIIKSQKEQLDAEYDKTINTLKTESKTVVDKVTDKTNEIKDSIKENAQNVLDETSETVKSGVDKLSDITGMKSLKDHLPSDSVDNLLQEIEDDLSSKSGKTLTSDTVSVKSIGKQSTPIKQVEHTEEFKKPDAENDDEDLKTEAPMPQNEKKISKLFGTFKRKKVSSTATLDSKILEVEDKIGSKISMDNKKEEVTNGKTDKTKTCTIL